MTNCLISYNQDFLPKRTLRIGGVTIGYNAAMEQQRPRVEPWQAEDAARLKAICKEARLTQETIGQRMGYSQSYVGLLLNGKRPLSIEDVLGFIAIINGNGGRLVTLQDISPTLSKQVARSQRAGAGYSNIEAAPDPKGMIPVISWVQAGSFMEVVDNFSPGTADEWVNVTIPVNRHTFGLRVKGDSMEPEFMEGTYLAIEPEMDWQPGDYVIAKNGDDEATFKQLVKDGADWFLKPVNPRYPIKQMTPDMCIVGVVREAVRKFR